MITTFLLSQWRLVAIFALTASTALMTHLWLGSESAKRTLEVEFKVKIAQAEKATKDVEDRSKRTLETINADHSILLAQAKSTAVSNYLKAHPPGAAVASVSLPGGAAGDGRPGLRMPANSAIAAYSGTANSSGPPDASATECVPPDAFIQSCAQDALTVTEWQRWARMNHLPVEGE